MTGRWLLLALLVPLIASAADLDAPAWRPDAMFGQMGSGASTHTWSTGWQWDWKRRWPVGDSLSLTGFWEISVGRWYAETNWRHSDLTWTTQFSTIPSVRLAEGWRPRWYAEFGVGPSLLLPLYVTRERTFSTEFNFETHLALGRLVGAHGQHDFSVRVDHYSNAGLAQPNPGVSLFAMRYTLHFGRSAPTPVFALPHAAAAYDFDRPAADGSDRPTASALAHTGAGDPYRSR